MPFLALFLLINHLKPILKHKENKHLPDGKCEINVEINS
jgi:hypothetical protein